MNFTDKISKHRSKILPTCVVCLSFLGLGMSMTLIGASLLDVQIRIQQSFSGTSRLILLKSLGYFVGGCSVGIIDDNFTDWQGLFIGNIISGISLIMAPWGTDFMWLGSFIFVANIGQGLVDLYSNLSIIHIWGEKASDFIQILHMCFGIGSLMAPLITRPFYLPLEKNDAYSVQNMTQTLHYGPADVKVQWAFLIIGFYGVIMGLIFFGYVLRDYFFAKTEATSSVTDSKPTVKQLVPTWKKCCAVLMVAVLTHLGFGVEFIIGNLAQAYSVKSAHKMDKKSGALMVTAFWTCFSLFKAIFIPLSSYFGQKLMVNFNLLVMVVSVFITVLLAGHSQIFLWISLILLGIGYSPLFAIAYSSLELYFEVTGLQTSIIFVSGVMGESIHPPLIGYFLDDYPNLFIYYLAVMSLLFVILMFFLPMVCERMFKKCKTLTKN